MYINKASLELSRQGIAPFDDSVQDYLSHYFDMYAEVEPHIQAFVAQDNRIERISKELRALAQRYTGTNKPLLFGIPVGIKDLIHVDGLPTRAGSNLPPSVLTGKEGSFIRSLRQKGIWIAGKTVTEEFAYAGSFPTRNPHHTDHTPGGSSAGSAAAVAAGLCPFAIGTQTLRSVLGPASFCGIVGFKPSYGRIPMDGVILLSPSFDTMGLFTQDIAGMEFIAASVIPNWESFYSERKPVLGIPAGVYMTLLNDEVIQAFKEQIRKLEEQGYKVKTVKMPWNDELIYGDTMLRLVQGEMAQEHTFWFNKYKDSYGPVVQKAIINGQAIEDEELERYRFGQSSLRNDLMELQMVEGIDLWVSPAQAGTAPLRGERTGWTGMTAIWSYAGVPAISIPSAQINNMPIGFQCIGGFGQDEEVIYWSRMVSEALSADEF